MFRYVLAGRRWKELHLHLLFDLVFDVRVTSEKAFAFLRCSWSVIGLTFSFVGLASIAQGNDIQRFDAWRVNCPGSTPDGCRVWQRVQVVHDGIAQDVMAVSIAPADDGLALLVQLPLDVYLPADFGLRIDGQNERRIRYRNCNEAGCWVVLPVDQSLISQLRRGITAEAALALVEGETVHISFSLRGFTAALSAFEEARENFE